jgi:hypothetical protein
MQRLYVPAGPIVANHKERLAATPPSIAEIGLKAPVTDIEEHAVAAASERVGETHREGIGRVGRSQQQRRPCGFRAGPQLSSYSLQAIRETDGGNVSDSIALWPQRGYEIIVAATTAEL